MNRDDLILVDTNVIIEAHRVRILAELLGALNLATVEACISETQAGSDNRRASTQIDETELRKGMTVFSPSELNAIQASLELPGLADVDLGERYLLTQAWLLDGNVHFIASPDKHPMRLAIEFGWRHRLVSLESVYKSIQQRKVGLRENYTERWHQATCMQFAQL